MIPGLESLPAVPETAIPRDVTDKDTYRAALGFEKVLLGQLTEEMTKTAVGEGAGGAYASLLPEALADGLVANGGLGLARTIYDGMTTP